MEEPSYAEEIHLFFAYFLNKIMEELNRNPYNSIIINKKINAFSDFTHKYGEKMINNEYLRNYSSLFYLNGFNHNLFGTSFYNNLNGDEQIKIKQKGSRQQFQNIPPENCIHESYDFIKNQILPSIENFFCSNIDLFNELKNEFNQIN
jgi:hypothetical protein